MSRNCSMATEWLFAVAASTLQYIILVWFIHCQNYKLHQRFDEIKNEIASLQEVVVEE